MRKQVAEKPYHAILKDGVIVEVGEGIPVLNYGRTVRWFANRQECETDLDVETYRRGVNSSNAQSVVNDSVLQQAYLAKQIEAKSLLAGDEYDPASHEFISIEVEEKGVTPQEAVDSIMVAIRRDVLEPERERVKAREKAAAATLIATEKKDEGLRVAAENAAIEILIRADGLDSIEVETEGDEVAEIHSEPPEIPSVQVDAAIGDDG